ncbi:hypothetical protein GIB67_010935 [Kingdonia uniflora]|uniref:PABC domain-containing protein n=1 Tax=Kingdonia uniflora TaxID=39325 RepID=A0A7J7M4N8_9MAGN|nr:hypothetical protein GIB67_010935 [Kingdonia uniflora]
MLGWKLYPLVDQQEYELAFHVTGMLLEMDQPQVFLLLESQEGLKAKVAEAMEILNTSQTIPVVDLVTQLANASREHQRKMFGMSLNPLGIEHLQRALEISPKNVAAYFGLASRFLGLSKECVNNGAFSWGASLLEETSDVANASTVLTGGSLGASAADTRDKIAHEFDVPNRRLSFNSTQLPNASVSVEEIRMIDTTMVMSRAGMRDRIVEEFVGPSGRPSNEPNSSLNAVMEEVDMVDEVENQHLRTSTEEIPFTYMSSLQLRWTDMKDDMPFFQGKIKCFLTGVKGNGFQFKGRTKFELHVYIDDGLVAMEQLHSSMEPALHVENGQNPVSHSQDNDGYGSEESWCDDGSINDDFNERLKLTFDLGGLHSIGYRDGITAGKKAIAQEGFNEGFKQSVHAGHKWGLVRGVSSALACLPDGLKEKLIETVETREKFHSLYESIHRVSRKDALKFFHGEILASESDEQAKSPEGNFVVPSSSQLNGYFTELESLLESSAIQVHLTVEQ